MRHINTVRFRWLHDALSVWAGSGARRRHADRGSLKKKYSLFAFHSSSDECVRMMLSLPVLNSVRCGAGGEVVRAISACVMGEEWNGVVILNSSCHEHRTSPMICFPCGNKVLLLLLCFLLFPSALLLIGL